MNYQNLCFYTKEILQIQLQLKEENPLSKWLKKDIGSLIGNQQKMDIRDDMVKGKITVLYNKYRVNRGIDESVFKKN